MTDKNIEMMKKIIAAKKQKSAYQTTEKRAPNVIGGSKNAIKKFKKGGLFDK